MKKQTVKRAPADRRVRERRARIETIRKAGAHVFAHHGYNQATMEMVAQEAEMGKASLYYYFKTKQELFGDIVSRATQEMAEGIAQAMSTSTEGGDKPSAEEAFRGLEAVFRFSLRYFREHVDTLALFLPLIAGGPVRLTEMVGEEVAAQVMMAHAPLFLRMEPVLGYLPEKSSLSSMLSSYLIGLATKLLHRGGRDLDAEVDLFLTLLRHALTVEHRAQTNNAIER